MPELPEVETTRAALAPHLIGRTITAAILRVAKLRLPLQQELSRQLTGRLITALERRGKYLLFSCENGTLLLHLGMTGHLRLVPTGTLPGRFDHVELLIDNGMALRLHDPRKFATLLWLTGDPHRHPLLADLGPEPLSAEFTPDYLYRRSRNRKVAIKLFIMNSKQVVGIGNIYANEALFRARLNPELPAGRLTPEQAGRLVTAIRLILNEAIASGANTLVEYLKATEKPGYFPLNLCVYGREGENCLICGTPLQSSRLGNRSTCWCPQCQPIEEIP
jgi:formamidopyrimidine-DNA glycosylase